MFAALALTLLFTACEQGPSSGLGANPVSNDPQVQQVRRESWGQTSTNAQTQIDPQLIRRNFYIILDGSASMVDQQCSGNEPKTVVAKRAIKRFAQSIREDDNIGFLAFDGSGVTERVSLGTNNREQFNKAVESTGADSNTPLGEAIELAYAKISEQAKKQLGYGEYHLVIVTDGEYNGKDPRPVIAQILAESPVVIHTIGFCIGNSHSLNQPGRTIYKDASNPKDIEEGLQAVLAESDQF